MSRRVQYLDARGQRVADRGLFVLIVASQVFGFALAVLFGAGMRITGLFAITFMVGCLLVGLAFLLRWTGHRVGRPRPVSAGSGRVVCPDRIEQTTRADHTVSEQTTDQTDRADQPGPVADQSVSVVPVVTGRVRPDLLPRRVIALGPAPEVASGGLGGWDDILAELSNTQ